MTRIAIGAVSIAALVALCALALPRGLADLRAFEVRMFFKSWETKRREPTAEEWTLALGKIQEARDLDPGQPNYHEDIARLYQFPAHEDLRKALDFQKQAVRLRPGSPYTWANIAQLKARLPEPDGEFETALRNAALLGPWEPEVQLMIAEAGFRHWNTLTPETRVAMRSNATRALRWQDAKLFTLARRTGRLDVLCGLTGVQRSPLSRACI